ncbi:hypothetical protein [uncultured Helicobacter sp.]|uniref:hypothetical protein n=1 Tax=uncultured Helicobacter sp. TaxID=175537 RepID=UPI00374EC141
MANWYRGLKQSFSPLRLRVHTLPESKALDYLDSAMSLVALDSIISLQFGKLLRLAGVNLASLQLGRCTRNGTNNLS